VSEWHQYSGAKAANIWYNIWAFDKADFRYILEDSAGALPAAGLFGASPTFEHG